LEKQLDLKRIEELRAWNGIKADDAATDYEERMYRDTETALRAAAEMVEWQPIESAPRDGTVIEVYAPSREGLRPMVSLCEWHPDAGFTICELRYVTHWKPHTPPAEGGA